MSCCVYFLLEDTAFQLRFLVFHHRYTNGITYFFKGHNYYRFNDTTLQVEPGYPQSISSFWEGIPDDIDTVFTWSNGYTYFFKGNQFYRFNCRTGRVDRGYPRPLAQWRGMLYQP